MRGFNNEAWVTSVLNEDEVTSALVLCAALKNVCTNRWICAVVSMSKTSLKSRDALNQRFDLIFLLDEDRNGRGGGKVNLNFEDFAKLSIIQCMRSFGRCVYLEPGMMPLKNCDEIFQIKDRDQENDQEVMRRFIFLENLDTSVFVFQPSMGLSLEIMKTFNGATNGNNGLKSVLKKWTRKNENENELYLDEKYNWKFSLDNVNENWLDNEISMLNFENSHVHIDLETCSKLLVDLPLPIKLAFNHWRNLHLGQKEILAGNIPIASKSSDWKKEPIAIVGMSCRYPQANNLEEFWKILVGGEDATGNPPPFRWLREDSPFFNPECRKSNAGFLKVPIDQFDSRFFGISPKEMESMDPQHRLLLEVIWESLEDAAIDPHSLQGSSGSVFLGSWLNDYKDICASTGKSDFYRGYMGNSIGAMAARISHFLSLTGPSIATESGCSSSMVALHLACKSLRQGETNLALAGGVNLLLRPFQKDFMPMVISPDGHCKTFDESANGFARAEGCGVLVLKRLSDAVKDGDRIWALIRGTGVSQEGTSKSMGTPTVHSESLAMEQALEDANVRPEEISYVEAHGTGTVVGDPLEVAAIAKVYHSKERMEPLIIGSVKANVGHTESCSGITGIMKVVLSMVHEMIPPQQNLTKLNPAIDLDAVPAKIPLEPVKWLKKLGDLSRPRIAGVSSFGITGTDAHAVIEESPNDNQWNSAMSNLTSDNMQSDSRKWHILKLSAKTEQALDILLEKIQETIAKLDSDGEDEHMTLGDLCFTANTGRANFPWRAVVTGRSREEFVNNINNRRFLKGEFSAEDSSTKKICFLFTGQGSQYPGMARNLYETSPVFQMHFEYCAKILQKNYGVHIKDVLWSKSDSGSSEISRTIYSQTSIFCVEYALLKLWESLGVTPDLVLGHSLGEFAAAVAAGILSVSDALKLVAERSLLIDKLPTGKMLVIKADHSTVSSHMSKLEMQIDLI